MNLLLDTHIALWALVDDPRLPVRARQLILSQDATVWVSAASLWEIAIKYSLGRGDMPLSGRQATGYFQEAGYRVLAITGEHTCEVETLPRHHADPFDRLLVAQARYEPMRLLTHDRQIAQYGECIDYVGG